MLAINFLNEYWFLIVAAILILTVLVMLIALISNYAKKTKTFKEDLYMAKSAHISFTVDLEEKIVEKYYLYDQSRKLETIPLDEFYVRFDKTNAEKLRNWLDGIAHSNNFNKTRRIELVMYNSNNNRGVYLVELEGYNPENKKYFLIFKDVTDSISVLKRIEKSTLNYQKEDFLEKVNERLLVCDEGSDNFLVAIKYKEYDYAKRELQNDVVSLLEENLFLKLISEKSESEIIQKGERGFIYLFSSSIANVKKYKKHLKNLLNACSGDCNILTEKFTYAVTLVAGYTKINKEEKISFDKIVEAETAANTILTKNRFADKIQLFDDALRIASNLTNNKLLAVEKVIDQTLFSINYVPIISTVDKTVNGYVVQIGLPHAINMNVKEFMTLVKQGYFRVALYSKVFSLMLRHKDITSKLFFISFDFDDLDKVMEAYESNAEFSKMDLYFCLEFSNITMQNYDLITIERKISHYKKNDKVRFGINYNTLTSIYLNAKIYSQADVVLLSGQLIDHALDNYTNESLLEVYTKVATSYAQEVIGLNVTSLAVYELFKHYKVKKVGGIYLTPHIVNDKIEDKFFLRNLEEIDGRNY